MIRFVLFAMLLAVPIAEIAVFLLVGSAIGVLPTIALVLLTAVIGAVLLKRQGVAALMQLQSDLRANRVPAAAIGQAITVAIAGVLLLTPGFITDTLGILLFIPAVRSLLWRQIAGSVKIHRAGSGDGPSPFTRPRPRPGQPQTIDLEATEVRPGDPSSPWRDEARRLGEAGGPRDRGGQGPDRG